MRLVLDIGNSFLHAAIFKGDAIHSVFQLSSRPLSLAKLRKELKARKPTFAMIGSDNLTAAAIAEQVLNELEIPFEMLSPDRLSIQLAVEKPHEVGHDRIANCYGALALHPEHNCLVIDLGTAVTFDVVLKDRRFIGGAIYPGPQICAKALNNWTDKLPLVKPEKPPHPISNSTLGNIQSGLYYGLLGAIERMIREVKQEYPDIIVIGTGGIARSELREDLETLIAHFEPELTLLGLYRIAKERKS